MRRSGAPRGVVAAVSIGLFVTAAGCGAASDDGPSGNDSVVRIALAADPSSLDPQAVQDGNALSVYDNVAETLVVRDAVSADLHPGLALSWKAKNDTTWRFALRQGVKFSDGEPFNADAVVYSINRIINPDFGTEQSWVGPISGATKVDEYTVDIETKEPDPVLPARLSAVFMVPTGTDKSADFAKKPIGTGPYTVVSWVKGDKIVLKANPNYWDGEPSVHEVVFQPIQEPTVRMAALTTGQVDLVPGLLPEQRDTAPSVEEVRGPEYPALILNTRGGPFADPLVRKAANYAVDKETLLKTTYGSLGTVGQCQLMGKDVFGFNPDLKPYEYDPAKAKALLAQAGDSHPSITLVGDSSNRWLKDVELEQAVAGYLTAVGFKVKLQLSDFSTYLKNLFPKKNSATVTRPDMVFFSRSNDIPDATDTFTGWYTTTGVGSSTADHELDNLVAAGAKELDPAKRLKIYQQVNKVGCDSANFLFLLNLDSLYGKSKALQWTPRVDGQILVKTMKFS